mmetsp:Transcript_63955/g.73371  ORF Transcript_63955/g.73371 Transcript_63955/m.73371 type:complete len:175 (+) Transcript_63955:211-735(+)|eukprot:CAMPEP_0115005402 /NCGR_PEP_ID=MMETSP0216-20121206/19840_1 /TAXON_ID=223996 /ORGANISM="Protocruzia adherens, Strain Boccale" /LENGTH=174 /DNA_ID=CAMNT_0002371701 /DNA_START=201 /DNA_END=725 /DNA_ORIENTATION=+
MERNASLRRDNEELRSQFFTLLNTSKPDSEEIVQNGSILEVLQLQRTRIRSLQEETLFVAEKIESLKSETDSNHMILSSSKTNHSSYLEYQLEQVLLENKSLEQSIGKITDKYARNIAIMKGKLAEQEGFMALQSQNSKASESELGMSALGMRGSQSNSSLSGYGSNALSSRKI